jgi:hypothetical protein
MMDSPSAFFLAEKVNMERADAMNKNEDFRANWLPGHRLSQTLTSVAIRMREIYLRPNPKMYLRGSTDPEKDGSKYLSGWNSSTGNSSGTFLDIPLLQIMMRKRRSLT